MTRTVFGVYDYGDDFDSEDSNDDNDDDGTRSTKPLMIINVNSCSSDRSSLIVCTPVG